MEITNKSRAYKNVIDWLNGRCRAFTDPHANAKSKLIGLMEGRNHRDLLPWNHV